MIRHLALGVFVTLALVGSAPAQEWTTLLGPGMKLEDHWVTKGNWQFDPKDGVVHLVPRKGEVDWKRYNMYLWSKKRDYTDFEIQFEYKTELKGNSGFYFHVGDVDTPVSNGTEVQIYDSASRAPGSKLNDHDSGGIIPGIPPTKNAARPTGEWNKFHITVKGKMLKVVLNDEVVNEVPLGQGRLVGRPTTGAIGFQDHGLPVWFRDIKIRELK